MSIVPTLQTVNVALVGAGRIGTHHATALAREAPAPTPVWSP